MNAGFTDIPLPGMPEPPEPQARGGGTLTREEQDLLGRLEHAEHALSSGGQLPGQLSFDDALPGAREAA